jgi:hypothetical protein
MKRLADRPPATKEAVARRLMGDAFVHLVCSPQIDAPQRAEASKLAEWLFANVLTPEQRNQFMGDTGWIIDPEFMGSARGFEITTAADADLARRINKFHTLSKIRQPPRRAWGRWERVRNARRRHF